MEKDGGQNRTARRWWISEIQTAETAVYGVVLRRQIFGNLIRTRASREVLAWLAEGLKCKMTRHRDYVHEKAKQWSG